MNFSGLVLFICVFVRKSLGAVHKIHHDPRGKGQAMCDAVFGGGGVKMAKKRDVFYGRPLKTFATYQN